jgi:glyoxylase-like metal-dependent hydrolase (beta-lactamase superfamily II)
MVNPGIFQQLGLRVVERGWLSSNNVLFQATRGSPATVIDTGYDAHSEQTISLLSAQLGGHAVERVLNTHLHSDHCGGNAALQARWGCEVWVPEASADAVAAWDESRLSFRATDQRCRPFKSQRSLQPGERLRIGTHDWDIIAAAGHDPDALMFHQRDSGVLITADALWEDRLAIIFPELAGEAGFAAARAALDTIEKLEPTVVIPGHGRPFAEVAGALKKSRQRIEQFEREPERHFVYAERALTMFHMLEHRSRSESALVNWLTETPIFRVLQERLTNECSTPADRAKRVIDRLIQGGLLKRSDDRIFVV